MATNMTRALALTVLMALSLPGLTGCATPASSHAHLAHLSALQDQADQHYAKHEWRQAATDYKTLTQKVPANAAYWFRLGNCLARLDQPQPAAIAYHAALQRNPRIAPAWHNLGSVLLKQAQAAYGQAAAAAGSASSLQRRSRVLAARVQSVRTGQSRQIPVADDSGSAAPATAGGTRARARIAPADSSSASGPAQAVSAVPAPHSPREGGEP